MLRQVHQEVCHHVFHPLQHQAIDQDATHVHGEAPIDTWDEVPEHLGLARLSDVGALLVSCCRQLHEEVRVL